MNDLVYIWFATGIVFLLIEMVTAAFYGLAVSIASFALTIYVFFSGDTQVDITQGIILVCISAVLAYTLPRFLRSSRPEMKTGLDAYIGRVFPLEKVGNDWKLKIDGVDYLIADESVTDDFAIGKRVEILSQDAGVLTVLVKK